MLHLCLVLILSASVFSESVRETETWMPMKTTQTVAMSTNGGGLESSGDSPNGSDFGFTGDDNDDEDDEEDDDDYYPDTLYDDEDEYDESSGSGDGATTVLPDSKSSVRPNVNDNKIPEAELPVRPTVNEIDLISNGNEIPSVREKPKTSEEYPSNVLMSHASNDSILNKKDLLVALIAGCAVGGLMFAALLILLLVYRMKKKDEGSYDLGKKPIYKKAPTTEIYA